MEAQNILSYLSAKAHNPM